MDDATPEETQATLDILRGARTLLANHGCIKGIYGNPTEGFCSLGAIRWAAAGAAGEGGLYAPEVEYRTRAAVYRASTWLADQIYGKGMRSSSAVVDWNDAKATTCDMVLAKFDETIAAHTPTTAEV